MALDGANEMRPWWLWAPALRSRETAALAEARVEHAAEIAFWNFVQWQFDVQCAALRHAAHARGVHVMGDLPIFVADNSSDVWSRPDLYFPRRGLHPSVVAGVPPDELGARWASAGAIRCTAGTACRPKASLVDRARAARAAAGRRAAHRPLPRLRRLLRDSRRPPDREGRRLEAGAGQGAVRGDRARAGPLPIVAEDLGLITPDVIELREGCGFPGMKILQFAFGGDGNHEFLPHTYTRDTVVYTGTHDNETARGWWQNAPERQRHFAGVYLGCTARTCTGGC
jgi:4-alpha-glucanotransferase